MTLLCKNLLVTKSKEVKTGCKLAESSKEGYGSKKGCFADDGGENQVIENYNPSYNMTCCNVMFNTSLYCCRNNCLERLRKTMEHLRLDSQ
jgi:hypothetical protein